MSRTFGRFTDRFDDLFWSGNHNVVTTARHYVSGLIQAEKRNMERMVEAVPDSDYQVVQNFLTHSSWAYRPVMIRVASNVSDLIGGEAGAGFFVDESAFAKKGTQSVGVARQWNGRLGKEDNCQVGVFGALGRGDRVALVDARLYLPKEWTDDPARCELAGIPRAERLHRTKIELAQEIIRDARANGVQFEWVGVDGGYGHSLEFLESLDKDSEVFLADIHSDRDIYLTDPSPYLPPQSRVRHESDAKAIEVRKWVKKQPESGWQKKTLRDSTRGDLIVEVLHQRIWLWNKKSATARCWHLIVRREMNSPGTMKYSLSNAPAETSVKKLAQMQGQRFWIERAFQDAKSHIGMAQYQARGWASWHRHMALVMMAMLFMLEARIEHADLYPLLSCYDIQILLAKTLPDRRESRKELIRQMLLRHQQRQDASAARSRG